MKEVDINVYSGQSVSRAGTRIVEYGCLRVIATLLVVLGHCVYYRIITNYGGIDYSDYVATKSLVFLICEKLKVLIYLFHMPLFVALSGAVFVPEKYASLDCLMKNKARRLLIPFIVVTVCYSFPLKYVSGSFGIYLYSDTWNYIILAVGIGTFGSYLFESNIGAFMMCASRFS